MHARARTRHCLSAAAVPLSCAVAAGRQIDFGRPASGDLSDPGTCILADMDATTQNGRTAPNPAYDLYERHPLAASQPALGPAGCSADLGSIADDVTAICCADGGCDDGAPQTCR